LRRVPRLQRLPRVPGLPVWRLWRLRRRRLLRLLGRVPLVLSQPGSPDLHSYDVMAGIDEVDPAISCVVRSTACPQL
jgi:hypothetical protein